MAIGAAIGALTTAAGAAGGGGGGSSSAKTGDVKQGATFNIAPNGLNLGEILQPFTTPPENGGYGLSLKSPGFGGSSYSIMPSGGSDFVMPAVILAIGGVLLFGLSRGRRGN